MKRKFEDRHNRLEFGENSCKFCFGGKDAPDAPDYTPVIEASEYSAELGFAIAMEQLQWSQEQWDQQMDLVYSMLDVQMPIMLEQWDISKEQWEWAKSDRERYETVFQPLEDELIQEFWNYASPERMELEAGRAGADVTRAFEAQRENAQRELESYGIDPSQTRSQALDAQMRVQEGAAQAGAENAARVRVEDTGRALKSDVVNMGRGLPSQAASSVALAQSGGMGASNVGSQGLQGYNQTYTSGSNAMGSPTQWYGMGQQGYNNAANMMNMQYNNQLAGWNAEQQYSPWNSAMYLGGQALGGWATGGGFADGGAIEGPGGPKTDSVPIRASDGEFMIPAEVVERKGTEFFDKLIEKTRQDPVVAKRMAEMRAQAVQPQNTGVGGYAEGGLVAPKPLPVPSSQIPQPTPAPVYQPPTQREPWSAHPVPTQGSSVDRWEAIKADRFRSDVYAQRGQQRDQRMDMLLNAMRTHDPHNDPSLLSGPQYSYYNQKYGITPPDRTKAPVAGSASPVPPYFIAELGPNSGTPAAAPVDAPQYSMNPPNFAGIEQRR